MLSVEALHQLHIFIFILAIAHVIFCVLTMLLGTARVSIIEILLILRVCINLLVSNDFNSILLLRFVNGNTGRMNFRKILQKMVGSILFATEIVPQMICLVVWEQVATVLL